MSRLFALLLVVFAPAAAAAEVSREPLAGDVAHYTFTIRVGDAPNAVLRLHRVVRELAPWIPRPTVAGAMMLHGDFATFPTNFAAMALYLAQRDIDAWGADRRWATTPLDGDTSDFGDMTFAQELDDIGHGLAIARAVRLATGSGFDRLTLVGFSRGGQLAYAYTAGEADLPASRRHVKTLVPLDAYAVVPPEDGDARAFFCEGSAFEYELVAAGFVDADNSGIIELGQLALTAPDETSPNPRFTNLQRMLRFVGQTYLFFAPTPLYHLNATEIVDGLPAALRESDTDVVATWLASAPPHQSLIESADGDALWCGAAPLPVPYAIGHLRVPLFYLGAAGGFGDHGLYTTTLVASREVRTLVVRRLPPDDEEEDFGHADLLFARDAAALAWQPLAAWILEHR